MVITKWWSRSGDRADLVLDFIWTTRKFGLEALKCALTFEGAHRMYSYVISYKCGEFDVLTAPSAVSPSNF